MNKELILPLLDELVINIYKRIGDNMQAQHSVARKSQDDFANESVCAGSSTLNPYQFIRLSQMKSHILQKFTSLSAIMLLLCSAHNVAAEGNPAFIGTWIINEELSDDTDKQVERAIKDAGGKVGRTKKKGKGRYKGGPPEQAMYDHISYDEILEFRYQPPEFRLTYAEGFERIFHSDGRRRSVSARGKPRHEREDFAFASWSGPDKLFVESRPRDGGRTSEVYTLKQTPSGELLLYVEMELRPLMFSGPIQLKRVYQRKIN